MLSSLFRSGAAVRFKLQHYATRLVLTNIKLLKTLMFRAIAPIGSVVNRSFVQKDNASGISRSNCSKIMLNALTKSCAPCPETSVYACIPLACRDFVSRFLAQMRSHRSIASYGDNVSDIRCCSSGLGLIISWCAAACVAGRRGMG
jgi:hypothetical protein